MKLYLLKPVEDILIVDNPWGAWFDRCFGFVVRAENEQEARKIATKNSGDEKFENKNCWLDPFLSNCTELTSEGEKGLIIRDHRGA